MKLSLKGKAMSPRTVITRYTQLPKDVANRIQNNIKDVESKIEENIKKKYKIILFISDAPIIYPNDVLTFYRVIHRSFLTNKDLNNNKNYEVLLVLYSLGGDIDAAYKIVKILYESVDDYVAYIPFVAKSAATIIALGAKELWLNPLSELGPIDPIVKHPIHDNIWVPARAIRNFIEVVKKEATDPMTQLLLLPLIDKLDPWIVGDYENAFNIPKQYIEELLSRRGANVNNIDEIVEFFTETYSSHGYPVDRNQLISLGINVKKTEELGLHETLWDLYESIEDLRDKNNMRSIIATSSITYARIIEKSERRIEEAEKIKKMLKELMKIS